MSKRATDKYGAAPVNVTDEHIERAEEAIRAHSMSYFKVRDLDCDLHNSHLGHICRCVDWIEPWRDTSSNTTTWVVTDE